MKVEGQKYLANRVQIRITGTAKIVGILRSNEKDGKVQNILSCFQIERTSTAIRKVHGL